MKQHTDDIGTHYSRALKEATSKYSSKKGRTSYKKVCEEFNKNMNSLKMATKQIKNKQFTTI